MYRQPDCALDVDECVQGSDNCNVNANCSNMVGGFTCSCLPGYEGDGVLYCWGTSALTFDFKALRFLQTINHLQKYELNEILTTIQKT